jgi:phage antirepressor YoqD-like protein|nr:MAG TPA: KilA protein [Caudoviricetes sp.]
MLQVMANELNQIFQYNGSPISFQKGNSVMVNATEMAKPFGKLAKDWLSNKSTKEFLSTLSAVRTIPLTDLVKIIQGGNCEQGTWMHEDVALEFARWLSPAFAIWCNDRIKELLTTGVTTVSNDDEAIAYAMTVLQKRLEQAKAEKELLAKQNAKLQPKADFADAAFATNDKVDIGMAAKILKLGFGRNTLFQKLRQAGVFFSNRNEPKQRFVNAGYFEMKEKFIERDNHPGFVVTKTLVTQKGLAYINHLFGGNPSDGKLAKMV